jgi:hypothetical protein
MKHYLITLIHGDARTVRNIIANSSMAATKIGIAMLPATTAPLAIICKPVRIL